MLGCCPTEHCLYTQSIEMSNDGIKVSPCFIFNAFLSRSRHIPVRKDVICFTRMRGISISMGVIVTSFDSRPWGLALPDTAEAVAGLGKNLLPIKFAGGNNCVDSLAPPLSPTHQDCPRVGWWDQPAAVSPAPPSSLSRTSSSSLASVTIELFPTSENDVNKPVLVNHAVESSGTECGSLPPRNKSLQ